GLLALSPPGERPRFFEGGDFSEHRDDTVELALFGSVRKHTDEKRASRSVPQPIHPLSWFFARLNGARHGDQLFATGQKSGDVEQQRTCPEPFQAEGGAQCLARVRNSQLAIANEREHFASDKKVLEVRMHSVQ